MTRTQSNVDERDVRGESGVVNNVIRIPSADPQHDQCGVEILSCDGASTTLTKYVELLASIINEDDEGG